MLNCKIYVDNDNIQFSKYDKIISELFHKYNTITKIFLSLNDLNNLNNLGHIDMSTYDFHVCFSPAKSKNSADISLVIECMEEIHSYDTFIIISNDSDFIPLCKKLRSYNKKCILCYDGHINKSCNKIYNETYDLSHLLKLENDKIQKQKELELQKQKQKEFELQKQKELELQKQKQKELELQKQKEFELRKKKEFELRKQKELELLNKSKQIEINRLNEINRKVKLSQYKKNEVSAVLDIIFDNNINNISFDVVVKIFNKYKLNYVLDIENRKTKLKKFLELYLPNKYYIKNNRIYIK